MNKDLIHSRFSRHLKDYDEKATVQKRMAQKLAALCSEKKYKNILEIGCGTGFLTEEAVKHLEFETYTAIDIVGECQEYITKISNRINFINADIEQILSSDEFVKKIGYPDLIISNAALQWTNDFEGTVKKLQSLLKNGGECIFSTFGKENFREIFYVLGTTLGYYSESELKAMFPNADIHNQEVYILSFNSPKEVLKHIQLTGVNGIENKSWTKGDLQKFEAAYSGLCAKRPTLTYNPIYIKITNPKAD